MRVVTRTFSTSLRAVRSKSHRASSFRSPPPAHVAAALASERARWRRWWRQRRQRQLINALLVGRGAGASRRSRLRARALDGARRRDVGALALVRALGPLVVDAALPPTPRTYGGGGPPPFGAAEARAQRPLLSLATRGPLYHTARSLGYCDIRDAGACALADVLGAPTAPPRLTALGLERQPLLARRACAAAVRHLGRASAENADVESNDGADVDENSSNNLSSDPPRLASARLASPRLASPRLASPHLASTRLNSVRRSTVVGRRSSIVGRRSSFGRTPRPPPLQAQALVSSAPPQKHHRAAPSSSRFVLTLVLSHNARAGETAAFPPSVWMAAHCARAARDAPSSQRPFPTQNGAYSHSRTYHLHSRNQRPRTQHETPPPMLIRTASTIFEVLGHS